MKNSSISQKHQVQRHYWVQTKMAFILTFVFLLLRPFYPPFFFNLPPTNLPNQTQDAQTWVHKKTGPLHIYQAQSY
jgi:hypothetical protein